MNMMQDPLYREIILEHWDNPQNYGELEHASFDNTEFNETCGDKMRIMGKVKDGKLVEISFISQGCAISKASASLFTQQIKNKKLDQIKKITGEKLLEDFPVPLAPARFNCALLCLKTIQKALE